MVFFRAASVPSPLPDTSSKPPNTTVTTAKLTSTYESTYVSTAKTTNYTTPSHRLSTDAFGSSTAATEPSTGTYSIESSTAAPITTTARPCPTSGFDTASFFGGILLALGTVVIAYVAYRWYRSRHAGPPYHQF